VHPFILGKAHDPDFQPQADHPVTNFQKVGFPQFMGREFFEDLMVLCWEICWRMLADGKRRWKKPQKVVVSFNSA